jgi:hypothetical protein
LLAGHRECQNSNRNHAPREREGEEAMNGGRSDREIRKGPRGARAVGDLLGDVLSPAARRRGFASVDIIAHWAEIVGPAYADVTQPERLLWSRRLEDGGEDGFVPATLVVRCEGPRALLLQHELPVLVERINAMFGYAAVDRIRIVQRPIARPAVQRAPRLRALSIAEERRIALAVEGIEDEGLRAALERLGRGLIGRKADRSAT